MGTTEGRGFAKTSEAGNHQGWGGGGGDSHGLVSL